MAEVVCWNCGASLKDIPRPISRHANCPKCFEVLHCCRMCRWYAPGRPADCDHDRADPPVEKESANFCDYFSPIAGAYAEEEGRRKSGAKSKLDSLFGDAGDEGDGAGDGAESTDQDDDSPDDDVRSRLDDLFKD